MRFLFLAYALCAGALAVAACTGDDPAGVGGPEGDDDERDAASGTQDAGTGTPTDSAVPTCWEKPFGKPVPIAEVSATESDEFPRYTLDRDELYLGRSVPEGVAQGGAQVGPAAAVVRYTRPDGGAWSAPTTLPFNDIGDGGKMNASSFTFTRDSKSGFFLGYDAFGFYAGARKVTRLGPNGVWSPATRLTVKGPAGETPQIRSLQVNEDGSRLYYSAVGSGNEGIFQAPLSVDGFGPSRLIGFTAYDMSPVLSRDELRIYFGSSRPHPGGVEGIALVYTARRTAVDAEFGPVEFVVELNDGAQEMIPTWLSDDGCTMLLSGRPTGQNQNDVYVATRTAS